MHGLALLHRLYLVFKTTLYAGTDSARFISLLRYTALRGALWCAVGVWRVACVPSLCRRAWPNRARASTPAPGATARLVSSSVRVCMCVRVRAYIYSRDSTGNGQDTTQIQQEMQRAQALRAFVWVLSPLHSVVGGIFLFFSSFFIKNENPERKGPYPMPNYHPCARPCPRRI